MRLPRPPRTAITMIAPEGVQEGVLMRTMHTVRAAIALDELSILDVKARRAVTRAFLLEVPGEGYEEKADLLAARMAEILKEEGVRIARPVMRTDVRIRGLDDSATAKDVALAIAKEGAARVTSGWGIFGSPLLAWAPSGHNASQAARRMAEKGQMTMSWVSVVVKPLRLRPL